MKKFVLTSLLLIVLCAVSSAESVYYLKAEFDGKMNIIGRYPVISAQNTGCYRFTYLGQNNLMSVEHLKNEKPAADSFFGANVSKVMIEYVPGFVKYSYYDRAGNPSCSDREEYSLRYKLNEKGEKASCFVYGKDGQLCENKNGVAQFVYLNDDNGRIKKINMAGKNGEQIADLSGVYTVLRSYDDQGRLSEVKYLGKDGKPAASDKKYSRAMFGYDEKSNITEERYLSSGEGYVKKTDLEFLAAKAPSAWSFIAGASSTDEAVQIKESFPSDIADFKTPGDFSTIEAKQLFDKMVSLKRELIPRQDIGICRITRVFDNRGNVLEERYYGEKGQLKDRSDLDVAVMRWTFTETGNISREAYFGIDEQPKESLITGIAFLDLKYDTDNRPIECRYFGTDGVLRERKDLKCAIMKLDYPLGENCTRTMYFDAKEQPLLFSDGYYGKRIWLDGNGAVTEEAFLAQDGKPAFMPKLGYAMVRYKRDAKSNIIEERYYTVDSNFLWSSEKLSENAPDGTAVIKRSFDDKGRIVEESYYGSDEQPRQPNGKTYDYVKYTYDNDGKIVNTSYVRP